VTYVHLAASSRGGMAIVHDRASTSTPPTWRVVWLPRPCRRRPRGAASSRVGGIHRARR
jgi:hypothetical protein